MHIQALLKKGGSSLAAVIADVGTVTLVCVALFAAAMGVMEFFGPGMAVNAVAPQAVAALAVAALAASLAGAPPRRSWLARGMYFLAEVAVTGFACWAAWRYFASVPERGWLTAGIGLTVGILLMAASKPIPEQV